MIKELPSVSQGSSGIVKYFFQRFLIHFDKPEKLSPKQPAKVRQFEPAQLHQ